MPLYHREIYLPEPVRTLKRVNLSYRISGHARQAVILKGHFPALTPIQYSLQDALENKFDLTKMTPLSA